MSSSLAQNSNGTAAQGSPRTGNPWTPLHDLLGFDPFQNMRSSGAYEYDVTRTENGFEVEVPVPGFKPDHIEITVKDGVITVSGKSERRTFSRSFTIPDEVDEDGIEAQVADGMLVMSLKRRPEAQPKRIQVK